MSIIIVDFCVFFVFSGGWISSSEDAEDFSFKFWAVVLSKLASVYFRMFIEF